MMTRPLLLVATLAALSCSRGVASHTGTAPLSACDLVIRHVRLFDGDTDRGVVDVAVARDRIVRIGSVGSGCETATAIDGAGKYVVPGLVNAHVHLWDQANLRVALQAGVFAVLDLHSSEGPDAAFRRLRDSTGFASYYSAGYAATTPGGHPTQLFPIETVNDSVTPDVFVAHRLAKGADAVKIVSGNLKPGSLWATNPTLSFAQIEAISRAAKARDRKVVVHVSQIGETVRIARMGVDGFAHLWSYGESATDEQLRVLKDAGVFIIPTVLLQQRAWQTIEREPNGQHAFQAFLSPMPTLLREIRRVHDAGIPIVAGTDAPNYGVNYGSDLVEELAIYSKAGLSNIEILRSATGTPARLLPIDGIGRIVEGARANLILLNADPLADVAALRDVAGIWKNGTRVR
jgi:imidazolonepropionase-like amidohydrolase